MKICSNIIRRWAGFEVCFTLGFGSSPCHATQRESFLCFLSNSISLLFSFDICYHGGGDIEEGGGYSPTFWVSPNLRLMLWTWVGGVAFRSIPAPLSDIILGQAHILVSSQGKFLSSFSLFPAEIWFLFVPSGYSFCCPCRLFLFLIGDRNAVWVKFQHCLLLLSTRQQHKEEGEAFSGFPPSS